MIGDEFSKFLQEQIDREVLQQVRAVHLVNEGWTKIPFIVKTSMDWFIENIVEDYERIGGAMYFKSHDDAVLYSLSWGDRGEYYD